MAHAELVCQVIELAGQGLHHIIVRVIRIAMEEVVGEHDSELVSRLLLHDCSRCILLVLGVFS